MLNIFYSNRIEVLASQLSSLIKHDPLPVFDKEFILVESAAMSQWLTQTIARNNGIAANIEFPFPAALLWQIYRSQQPDLPKNSSYDRQPLAWRLYNHIKNQSFKQPVFKSLSNYIDQLSTDCQLLGFSEYIASLFDQYQIYRPEILLAWSEANIEAPDDWQAAIWQFLHQEKPDEKDRASIFYDSMTLPLNKEDLPDFKRLQVFALSSLPKPYMDIIAKVSEFVEVNLFVLNPCALFWTDIKTRKSQQTDMDVDDENNDLLAMMARQGQDHMRLLQEYDFEREYELFVDQEASTLLQHLQKDMLYLQQKASDETKTVLMKNDNSLVFHACHSRLREVQVLKNQILSYLDQNKDISFDQIAVMVPDLESYTLYFYSVFNSQENPLPFHLAERRSLDKTSGKMALLQLCSLHEQQFSRSSVIDLLKNPMINRALGIADMGLIEQLLEDLQVHFALNDDEWLSFGDGMVSMAWEQARDRLIDSYCLPTNSKAGLMGGIDEQAADQAGRLCEFIARLSLLNTVKANKAPADWCVFIDRLLSTFMLAESDKELAELREIRSLLDNWLEKIELSELTVTLGFDVFYKTLVYLLENAPSQHYFRNDVINIATLLPMRSLPFSKICLLGMNDGEYPRIEANDPLDMMKQHPKAGDRNRQHEDRYLFLEAILSARDKLYISYIGKSHIDNTERFPSLLVAELLDFLDSGYQIEDAKHVKDRLVIHHALQAFDTRYFSPNNDCLDNIQTYDSTLLAQAESIMGETEKQSEYAATLVHDTHENEKKLWSLSEFSKALAEPQKWYLAQNQIFADFDNDREEDIELMSDDGLHNYQLLQRLLAEGRSGHSFSDAKRCCQFGLIPQGNIGISVYEQQRENAEKLLTIAEDSGLLATNSRVFIDVVRDYHRIDGVIGGLTANNDQCLAWLGEKIHGLHVLRAWVNHVLIQADSAKALHSHLISKTETIIFKPVPQEVAMAFIDEWLIQTDKASHALVHFFVKSSWKYQLQRLQDPENPDKSVKVLENALLGDRFAGEWGAEHHQYAYRGMETLPMNDIIQQAKAIFAPISDYMEMSAL